MIASNNKIIGCGWLGENSIEKVKKNILNFNLRAKVFGFSLARLYLRSKLHLLQKHNDWGDRVLHDFYNSNLIFTIQIWSSAGNVQSINFHWFILLGYWGGGKVLVETHLSFFISLPGSLYEAQVDLFTGRTFSHKMLEVVAGAPFIIKWWMAVNSRVTRTQPPITPDMKLTPDFPESISESWC